MIASSAAESCQPRAVSLNLDPARYLAGWRPDACALFLPVLSDRRVGEDVVVRIGLYGQGVRATVFGSIAVVRRVGRPSLPPGIDLALHPMSLPAARFLALAAREGKSSFHDRAPRWIVAERLLTIRDGNLRETTTLNVSESGCAMRWPDPLPGVGDLVTLKLGAGLFSPTAGARVCWNALDGAAPGCVGLRIVAGPRAVRAWKELALETARSRGVAA